MVPSHHRSPDNAGTGKRQRAGARAPTPTQLAWLRRGLTQPGGKLPLFDESGQRVRRSVVSSCRTAGWAESWFHNPIKPGWDICRLTEAGRAMLSQVSVVTVDFRHGHPGSPPPLKSGG
jgi:hypothetical protein